MSWNCDQLSGISCYRFAPWIARGIPHGFLLGELDFRNGSSAWDQFRGREQLPSHLALLRQVHRDTIETFAGTSDASALDGQSTARPEADAWIWPGGHEARDACLGILTADCLPVIAVCNASGTVAAAHCGWRSTVAGIVPKLIDSIEHHGGRRSAVELLVGPGIGQCCFEIGPEVVSELQCSLKKFGAQGAPSSGWIVPQGDKFVANLRELVQAQALTSGILAGHVAHLDLCTFCDHRFFSFRRQKDSSGRQVSFIGRPSRSVF